MKTHYIGDCHHLFCNDIEDENCLKRYFIVYDYWFTLSPVRLAICNDYIRLKINEEMAKDDSRYKTHHDCQKIIKYKIITPIIIDFLKFDFDESFYEYDFRGFNPKQRVKNKNISLTICERPFLLKEITTDDLLVFFERISDYNHELGREIEVRTRQFFMEKIDYSLGRVSLKKIHNEARILKNMLSRSSFQGYNWDIPRLIDFYSDVLLRIN